MTEGGIRSSLGVRILSFLIKKKPHAMHGISFLTERVGFAPAAQPPITPAFGANASQARPLPSRFALLPRRSNPSYS